MSRQAQDMRFPWAARAIATGMAAVFALAGCDIEVPEVSADPTPTITAPVVDEDQLTRILSQVNETLVAADEAEDADELDERVVNPARTLRAAEYRLAKATVDEDNPSQPRPLSTSPQVSIVAATDTWPRTVLVVTEIPEDTNAPLLLGLRQTEPRAPYALFHWSLLLPGVEFPAFTVPQVGVQMLEADATGFLETPKDAIAKYADVLSKGEDSDADEIFDEDAMRTLMADELKKFKENTEDAGTVEQSTKPGSLVVAMETAGGGALVLGSLATTQTFERTVSGSKMNVGGQLAALNDGEGEVEDKFIATYAHTVALLVPASGDEATIEVIAAERVLSSVKTESDEE